MYKSTKNDFIKNPFTVLEPDRNKFDSERLLNVWHFATLTAAIRTAKQFQTDVHVYNSVTTSSEIIWNPLHQTIEKKSYCATGKNYRGGGGKQE